MRGRSNGWRLSSCWNVAQSSRFPRVRRFNHLCQSRSDEPIELPQTAVVRRSPVVLVVAPEFGVERRGLILDRVVPMVLAPLRHRLHTAPKAFAHGPDVNREPPPSAARTDVRETEEVEGRRLSARRGRSEAPSGRTPAAASSRGEASSPYFANRLERTSRTRSASSRY